MRRRWFTYGLQTGSLHLVENECETHFERIHLLSLDSDELCERTELLRGGAAAQGALSRERAEESTDAA